MGNVVWQHQAIIRTNFNLTSVKSRVNHLGAISQEMPQPLIDNINLKITYFTFHQKLPLPKELKSIHTQYEMWPTAHTYYELTDFYARSHNFPRWHALHSICISIIKEFSLQAAHDMIFIVFMKHHIYLTFHICAFVAVLAKISWWIMRWNSVVLIITECSIHLTPFQWQIAKTEIHWPTGCWYRWCNY